MITTITLNASIDKAYEMHGSIRNGTVMRVAVCRNTAGGKGLNVARVAGLCGSEVIATGLVGGFNGAYLEDMLKKDHIRSRFGHVQGETRSCINILDDTWGSTEYLEPGCEVSEEEYRNFLEHEFREAIADSDVVTISGSAPKGLPKNLYREMITAVKEQGKKVILDTSGEYLKYGLEACPHMVKPNEEELEAILDVKIQSREDLIRCAGMLHEKGIEYVVVSLGGDGALMVCEEGVFQAVPPRMEVVNTVGCGDSMVGAFAVAMEQKFPAETALRYAVAVATANAMSPKTGDFDPEISREILKKVTVEKIVCGK